MADKIQAEMTRPKLAPMWTKSSPETTNSKNVVAASNGGGRSATCAFVKTTTICQTKTMAALAYK